MIKRLSTAAIGVALVLSFNPAQAAPYYGFDGRTYGEPAKAPNWGRPESKGPKLADDKGAPRKCLTHAVHAVLDQIEARFGPVKVISTCRPGARIAGSGRISRHASGNAVDFEAGNAQGRHHRLACRQSQEGWDDDLPEHEPYPRRRRSALRLAGGWAQVCEP